MGLLLRPATTTTADDAYIAEACGSPTDPPALVLAAQASTGAQGSAAAPQQSASDLQNSIPVPMTWCLSLRHAGAQKRQCNIWSRLLLLRPPGATAGHASPTLSSMECNTAAAASLDGLRSPAQHSTASAVFTLGSQQAHSRDCIWVAGLCPTL